MSGTSVDAVDAVLLEFAAHPQGIGSPRYGYPGTGPSGGRSPLRTLAIASVSFPTPLRQAIQSLQQPQPNELERAAQVSLELAELYAQATFDALNQAHRSPSEVIALGAHGQTVRHRPGEGYTIQLINAAQLAERTGIAVIHDFRSADVAAGGQGAPLVPAFHAHVFGSDRCRRAIVNIGGIANVSLLPRIGSDASPQVLGHDTGPGNTLLDQWFERHHNAPFDRDGGWAAGGTPDALLLNAMLSDPYFEAQPPKSTGRDHFNLGWLGRHLEKHATTTQISPRDVQATLAELTALTIARDCQRAGVEEVYLCGGGVFNSDLVRRIQARLPDRTVTNSSGLGISPMAVEAAAFAWLAARRIDNLPGNLPAVTGASAPRVLGSITDPLGRLAAPR